MTVVFVVRVRGTTGFGGGDKFRVSLCMLAEDDVVGQGMLW
jgi:hypothetical protein